MGSIATWYDGNANSLAKELTLRFGHVFEIELGENY